MGFTSPGTGLTFSARACRSRHRGSTAAAKAVTAAAAVTAAMTAAAAAAAATAAVTMLLPISTSALGCTAAYDFLLLFTDHIPRLYSDVH